MKLSKDANDWTDSIEAMLAASSIVPPRATASPGGNRVPDPDFHFQFFDDTLRSSIVPRRKTGALVRAEAAGLSQARLIFRASRYPGDAKRPVEK